VPVSSTRAWLWGPVFVYMAAIFFVSGMPEPPSPPGLSDKTGHFAAYGGLALTALRATSGGALAGVQPATVAAAWGIATLFGASDEFHQRFVPGRTADLADLGADALGAAVAMGVAWVSAILRRSARPRGAPPPVP
jgi:VanZ family protein